MTLEETPGPLPPSPSLSILSPLPMWVYLSVPGKQASLTCAQFTCCFHVFVNYLLIILCRRRIEATLKEEEEEEEEEEEK